MRLDKELYTVAILMNIKVLLLQFSSPFEKLSRNIHAEK